MTLEHTTLALTGLDGMSERPDQSSVHVKFYHLDDCLDRILQIALGANEYPILFYLKGSRRQWLRVNWAGKPFNCVKTNGFLFV